MDEPTQTSRSRKPLFITLTVLSLVVIGLIAALLWCLLWWHKTETPPPTGTLTPPAATIGPCKDGATNTLPAGFTWYENATLGYQFAYPSSWGTVTVTTTPIASESGDYVMGRFSANDQVWFGGNATDYIVGARDGIPTDLPGYVKIAGNYYTVGIWRAREGSTVTDRRELSPIAPPHEEKQACNAVALITKIEASELSSVGPADVAHLNLKPTSRYYGVNFVLNHPTDALRADFNKLVTSFQLL